MNTSRGYGVFCVGNFAVVGGTKSFIQPHPRDPSLSVQFICLEGNESGTYFRGNSKIVNGRAEIDVPQEWKDVTAEDGITVQVTPIGKLAVLAAVEVSRDSIVIRGSEDCAFAYFVNGVRRGFEEYEPYIPNTGYRPEVKGVPYGSHLPKALRDMLVETGVLNPDYTPNEATATRLGWKLKEPTDVPIEARTWLTAEERQRLFKESVPQPMTEPHERPGAPSLPPRAGGRR